MSELAVQKVHEGELPTLDDLEKRFEAIERRAFDLFERRGRESGHDLEDWLTAEHELGCPAAELSEKDSAYQIEVALPGFEPKEVEVITSPQEIVIHAATTREKKGERDTVVWTELGSNDFYRRFDLANQVEVGKVTASIENGLLHVTAPEMEKPKEAMAKAA